MPFTDPDVLAYCPAIDALKYDGSGESPEEVYVCSAGDILSLDGSTDDLESPESGASPTDVPPVQRASRVVGGLDELLAAYSAPNAAATAEACIQLAADPLIIWISGADEIAAFYAPVDECGFPQDTAADAYVALELEQLVETRLEGEPAPSNPDD